MNFELDDNLETLRLKVGQMVDAELVPHNQSIEEEGIIPESALQAIREFGIFGSHTPSEYGGLGLDMLGNTVVIMEMARAHIAYFYTYSMNVHIGSKPIELHGSEEQKLRWLPKLASGEWIGCYAITEESAGSDAGAAKTTAVRDGDYFVLNGTKRYITNGAIADLYTVFADVQCEQAGSRNLTAFGVERGTPGLEIGRNFDMSGGRGASQAEVFFTDCRVPVTNQIGSEGKGFHIAMSALDAGRINWAAFCVGAAQNLYNMTVAHVTEREQFGQPLSNNQGIQWMLADMNAEIHAAKLVCFEAAVNYEKAPEQRPLNGARAKLIASEMAGRVADTTIQLFGGEGYRKDRPIERIWRELRGIRILEGTSEIMRHIIARDTLRAQSTHR